MRNKKLFSFDEKRDAETIIQRGFPDGDINYTEMYLVAKYFRQTMNYGEIRLEREIIRFCKEQDKDFNPVVEATAIKKWVRSAMNYNLREIYSISISQKEINFLKTIEIEKDRKLLFMALVLSKGLKLGNTTKKNRIPNTSTNHYIPFAKFSDVIRLSGIKNLTEVQLADIFWKYKPAIIVCYPKRELVKLDYADKNPETEISLDNLNELLSYYQLLLTEPYTGKEKILMCANCKKETKKEYNNQKYCKACSVIVKKEKDKKRMKKKYEDMRNILH